MDRLKVALQPVSLAEGIPDMIADDKVTPLPTLLERIGRRIDSAWQRACKGDAEWIEGSLEAMQMLAEGSRQFPSNNKFGAWLKESGHDHWNAHDRAALINMAGDLTVAREVLTKTDRRSYQHIWNDVQNRFAHVSKTDKPKRGRPGKPRDTTKTSKRAKAQQPRPAEHHAAAAKCLDEGKSRVVVAAETGLSDHQVQLAREREIGRREERVELLGAAAAKNFSEKGALRIEDAIRIHTTRFNKQFEQRVNDEVRKRIDAADDATRAENKRLRQEVFVLNRELGQRGIFTETQHRQMLMLCHPDSSASEQLKAELVQVLVQNKKKLVRT